MNIGKSIKMFRKFNDMTIMDLAEKLNMYSPVLSKIENNKMGIKNETLVQISETFNVPLFLMLYSSLDKDELADMDKESMIIIEKQIEDYIENINL